LPAAGIPDRIHPVRGPEVLGQGVVEASPVLPVEGATPAATSRWVNRSAVFWARPDAK
jgi:hypothetical protein